jgi:ABC-type amino acid transport substrate-binding protein
MGGSSDEPVARKYFKKATIRTLPNASPADMVMQVKTNKATGMMLTNIYTSALEKKFDLVPLPKDANGLDPVPGSFGVRKRDPELTASINAFLKKLTDDGTIAALQKKYLTPEAFLNVFEQN